ncbi:MAG: UDP-N-acetylmuramate dehydrogenase [Balneolales bacterium]
MNSASSRILKNPIIREEVNLKPFNSFQVETGARYFADIVDASQLKLLIQHPVFREQRALALGGGSNILFRKYFDGLVLKISIPGIELIKEDEDHVWLKAGAGVNWHKFVLFCLGHNYAGVENLSLIPGNIGAAPIQNIGAYGVELDQVFSQLEAIEIKTGNSCRFDKDDCGFAYRDSVFKKELKDQFIITAVTIRLHKAPKLNLNYGTINQTLDEMKIKNPTIQNVSEAVCRIRRSKLPDPAELGNSGSFFKNPIVENSVLQALKKDFPQIPHYELTDGRVKIPAGWLIEKGGWKGKTIGKTGTHKKQALVIVNYGGATGSDIYDYAMQVQHAIKKEFGITLLPEVNVI